jgi:hypothetical protein
LRCPKCSCEIAFPRNLDVVMTLLVNFQPCRGSAFRVGMAHKRQLKLFALGGLERLKRNCGLAGALKPSRNRLVYKRFAW